MHTRCPISAVFGHYGRLVRALSCIPCTRPRRPSDDPACRAPFPLTGDPCPTALFMLGKMRRGSTCPPYIRLVKYFIQVETLLTLRSHLIPAEFARYETRHLRTVYAPHSFCDFNCERNTSTVYYSLPLARPLHFLSHSISLDVLCISPLWSLMIETWANSQPG